MTKTKFLRHLNMLLRLLLMGVAVLCSGLQFCSAGDVEVPTDQASTPVPMRVVFLIDGVVINELSRRKVIDEKEIIRIIQASFKPLRDNDALSVTIIGRGPSANTNTFTKSNDPEIDPAKLAQQIKNYIVASPTEPFEQELFKQMLEISRTHTTDSRLIFVLSNGDFNDNGARKQWETLPRNTFRVSLLRAEPKDDRFVPRNDINKRIEAAQTNHSTAPISIVTPMPTAGVTPTISTPVVRTTVTPSLVSSPTVIPQKPGSLMPPSNPTVILIVLVIAILFGIAIVIGIMWLRRRTNASMAVRPRSNTTASLAVGASNSTNMLFAQLNNTPVEPLLKWMKQLCDAMDGYHQQNKAFNFLRGDEDVKAYMTLGAQGAPQWRNPPQNSIPNAQHDMLFADVRNFASFMNNFPKLAVRVQGLPEFANPNSRRTAKDLSAVLADHISTVTRKLDSPAINSPPPYVPPPAPALLLYPEIGAWTHQGKHKPDNEDSFSAFELRLSNDNITNRLTLLAVSDGMGGEEAGEVASRLAMRELVSATSELMTSGQQVANPSDWVVATVQRVNNKVCQQAEHLKNRMGATLVFSLVDHQNNLAYLGAVGDSRIYRVNPGRNEIQRLSKDHSLVQQLVDAGAIKDEDRYSHPERNMVARGLGDKTGFTDKYQPVTVNNGDWLLLCSDGLWEMVRDPAILQICAGAASPQIAAAQLVDAANRAGGEDNIAVVIGKFTTR